MLAHGTLPLQMYGAEANVYLYASPKFFFQRDWQYTVNPLVKYKNLMFYPLTDTVLGSN